MKPFTLSTPELDALKKAGIGEYDYVLPADYDRRRGVLSEGHVVLQRDELIVTCVVASGEKTDGVDHKRVEIQRISIKQLERLELESHSYTMSLRGVIQNDASPREERRSSELRIHICDFTIRYRDVYQQLVENYLEHGEMDTSSYVCPVCGNELDGDRKICTHCWKPSRLFKNIIPYITGHKWLLTGSLTAFLISNVVYLSFPQLARVLVNDFLLAELQPGMQALLRMMGIMAGLYFIGYITAILRETLMIRYSERFVMDLRKDLFSRNLALGLGRIHKWNTGRIINILSQDTETVRVFFHNQLSHGINQVLVLSGVLIVLLLADPLLFLVLFVPLPLSILMGTSVNRRFKHSLMFYRRLEDRQSRRVKDSMDGIRVVKSFGKEDYETGIFDGISDAIRQQFMEIFPRWMMFSMVFSGSMKLGMILVWLYGGISVLNGRMNAGELVQFSGYAAMLYGPASFVSNIPQQLSQLYTALVRIWQVFEETPDTSPSQPVDPSVFEGDIVLENVHFSYSRDSKLYQGVNFSIPGKKMTGIVGPSGAGKTTLAAMLLKLYKPQTGEIRISGVPLNSIPDRQLRENIGIVMQNSVLLRGSVFDNLSFGREVSREQVLDAARTAQIHERIMSLPDGYNTLIGEGGYRLSGGEQQRLSIARALIKQPPVLILDEATSSLDADTEENVQFAIDQFGGGNHTAIVIAHRLSTLRNADNIVFINDGEIREQGSHSELMALNGEYATMVRTQMELARA